MRRYTFEGAKPGESASHSKTDANGNYELYYSRGHKGATIGEHKVYISTYQAPERRQSADRRKKRSLPNTTESRS